MNVEVVLSIILVLVGLFGIVVVGTFCFFESYMESLELDKNNDDQTQQ